MKEYGIHKFTCAENLFSVLNELRWDDISDLDCFSVGQNAFLDNIIFTVTDIYGKYLTGEYLEEKVKHCLGLGCDITESDLWDFEFLIFNEKNGCFYCNTIEKVNEHHKLTNEEKEIFNEIYKLYNLGDFIKGIIKMIDDMFKEENVYEEETTAWYCCDGLSDEIYYKVRDTYNTIEKKKQLFVSDYEIKLPKIIQSKYRIFVDPNIQTDEEREESFGHIDIDPDTKKEALEYFIKVYERYKKEHINEWDIYYHNDIYIRDNSTGEEIHYPQAVRYLLKN